MGGGACVLVVGVWGFPGSWLLAGYRSLVPPRDPGRWGRLVYWGLGERVDLHSTLVALAKTLLDSGWCVRVVVYGLDSLAAPPRRRDPGRIPGDDEVRRGLVEETNALIDEFYASDPRDYGEVVGRAERVLRLYVEGYFGEAGLDLSLVDLVVVPGVGVFQLKGGDGGFKRYVFRGSPQNTLALLELDLYRRLHTYRPRAVVLDVSHGINFLPVLAVSALRWAVKTYSALEGVEVGVAVVNSDPVESHGQEATLHLVDARVVSRRPLEVLADVVGEVWRLVEGVKAYKMLVREERPPKELLELDKTVRMVAKKYASLAGTMLRVADYGLLLYLAHQLTDTDPNEILKDAKKVEELLSKAMARRVEAGGDTVIVSHGFSLNASGILDTIYTLHLLAKMAREAPGLIEEVEGYRMAGLDRLRSYAERVGLREPAKTLLYNELRDLEKRVNLYRKVTGEALEKPTPYRLVYKALEAQALDLLDEDRRQDLLKDLEKSAESKMCDVDTRNFYAHAGLEQNAIAVAVKGDRILVGYHPQCLEKLAETIKESLEDS